MTFLRRDSSAVSCPWIRGRVWRGTLCLMMLAGMGADAPAAKARSWVWAWERAEDLSFLAGRDDVGVAFLAATATVGERGVAVRRRAHPVVIPDGMPRVAVVRIERRAGLVVADEPGVRAGLVAIVREVAALPGVGGVQIDYDARVSERAFYLRVLRDVRAGLPAGS